VQKLDAKAILSLCQGEFTDVLPGGQLPNANLSVHHVCFF